MSYAARGMALGVCLAVAIGGHVTQWWAAVVFGIGVVQAVIDMRKK